MSCPSTTNSLYALSIPSGREECPECYSLVRPSDMREWGGRRVCEDCVPVCSDISQVGLQLVKCGEAALDGHELCREHTLAVLAWALPRAERDGDTEEVANIRAEMAALQPEMAVAA